jgi:hypothetical protein
LSPAVVTPNPVQGNAIHFTAQFVNTPVAEGMPVTLAIKGANAGIAFARTDATGTAAFSYTGRVSGQDIVMAFGGPTVDSLVNYYSNATTVVWFAGKHYTFITLNRSPLGGKVNEPAVLTGTVQDLSVDPVAGVAGLTLHITAGPWSCDATTNAQGVATCIVTPSAQGVYSLTATFAGNSSYASSSVSEEFNVLGVVPPTLDVDFSVTATQYDALTDGLMVIRYLFGLTGPSITNGALGGTAARTDANVIKAYLDGVRNLLDVDGNGSADALTDGLLIIRYMFGLRGASLINGAIGTGATRTTAPAVETYIQSLMP